MTDYRNDEYRDVEVQRDENGMIIMSSERTVEPPPKTGGMAGIIFVAVAAVAGVGGYFLMENAPPAQEYAVEQSDAPQPYATPQAQQLALNETPTIAPTPAPAPVQRQAAPRAAAPAPVETPMPEPMPEAAPPVAPVDPIAPPPAMDLSTPPTGE